MTLLFTKNRNHVYFVKVHKILDIKILPYVYGRVRLATGYNENLFKHFEVVLPIFPN